MYDKKVRRRRAVLALLVGVSLILLTASFGSSFGPIRAIQRGVVEVLSPIQEGASRALKPVRDLAGWVGDTLGARKERDRLRAENQRLVQQAGRTQAAVVENQQLRRLVGVGRAGRADSYAPVGARVIGRAPTLWYATLEVDKGSDSGVRVDQPVIGDAGLVGKVTTVTSSTAIVTLITDHTSGVSAKVLTDRAGDPGTVLPAVGGDPNDLLMQFLPRASRVKVGDPVVTAGTHSGRLESLFPPDLPIGTVTKVSPDELALSQQVHLRPDADLRHLDFVQVLTRSPGSRARAQVAP